MTFEQDVQTRSMPNPNGNESKRIADRANETGARGMDSLGKVLDRAAGYLEEEVQKRELEGPASKSVEKISHGLHGAAQYLKDSSPRSALSDLDQAINKHPYRALAVGAGLGWVIGRLMRRD